VVELDVVSLSLEPESVDVEEDDDAELLVVELEDELPDAPVDV